MTITHAKVSAVPNSTDSSLIQPTDWNAAHVISGSTDLTGASPLLLPANTYTVPVTSWTPVLSFGGGTTGITYSALAGSYYQIGKLVWINVNFTLSSKGSSTGNAHIDTLPVPVNSTVVGIAFPCLYNNMGGGTLTGTGAAFLTTGSPTTIVLFNEIVNGAGNVLTDTAFTNTSILFITGCYPTN